MFVTKVYVNYLSFSIKDHSLLTKWTLLIQTGESVNYRNEDDYVSTIPIEKEDKKIKFT